MIRDRFILIVISLSSLVPIAVATEAKASKTSSDVRSIETSWHDLPAISSIAIAKSEGLSNSDLTLEQNDSGKNSADEEVFTIDKGWGLFGMAIVSAICLALLKSLFILPTRTSGTSILSSAQTKNLQTSKGDRSIPITQLSPDLETVPKPNTVLPSLVETSSRQPSTVAGTEENFDLIDRLTVLDSKIDKIDVVVELIQYLHQPDSDLRREAIWELAQIGDPRGIEPLTKILSQVGSTDRSLVLTAITQITRRSFQPVENLLSSDLDAANPEIKQNAIRDLAALYAFVAPITKQLARMQVDRDMQVRQTAKLAIEQLNLCYFPCLFDDCPGSAKHDLSSDKRNIDRVKQ